MNARGLLVLFALLLSTPVRAEPLKVAITIDDMPGTVLPPGHDAQRLTDALVAALKAHEVASATAFVIGERLRDPAGRAAIDAWIRAGYDVGNHTYSHRSLHRAAVGAYADDILRLDPLMVALERESGQRVRYFRYPFLEEGRSAAQRELLGQLLRARGYTLARVSIDFADWAWGDPYLRCVARGDLAALAPLAESYLASASASLAWSRSGAEQVLHRPLVHVLLLHANLATAHNLDALLGAYERAGAVFVPLAEALTDPAYTAEYRGATSHLLTLLSQRAGRRLPPAQPRPLAQLAEACR